MKTNRMKTSGTVQSDLKLAVYKLDDDSDKKLGITKEDIARYPDGFEALKEALIEFNINRIDSEKVEKVGFERVAKCIHAQYMKVILGILKRES